MKTIEENHKVITDQTKVLRSLLVSKERDNSASNQTILYQDKLKYQKKKHSVLTKLSTKKLKLVTP